MQTLVPALTLLLFATSLLVGCTYEPRIIEGWEDGGGGCVANSNPKIGQWLLSSTPATLPDGSPSSTDWLLGSHFAWRDPGEPEDAAEDEPQNMVGGWVSMEIEGHETHVPYITAEWLQTGCPPGDETACATLGFPTNQTGCNGSTAIGTGQCRDGSLTVPLQLTDGSFSEGTSFHAVMRVRDRCGAASNERDTYASGRYTIGSGIVEGTPATPPEDEGGS